MQKMQNRLNVGKLVLDPGMEPKPRPQQTSIDAESAEQASPAPDTGEWPVPRQTPASRQSRARHR